MFGSEVDHIGPYELQGELGRGAMARVWRAWDPHLAREVAIKEPMFDYRLSATVMEELGHRFVAEGRAAARLNHPGIVTIYAADVWDDRPAIVMELVEGETLASRLCRGPLNPQETLSVLDQLLDAVGYAHQHGVVHRDIKPDNVFITPTGTVKLADFGIAHIDDGASHATVAGSVLGTPGYMSPEQAVGKPVDARSDLFSVGVIAYEMLTGSNPFGVGEGTNATTLIYRIVHEPAPDLPPEVSAGLPADLRPAIMAALAKDPDWRPATAEAFKALLHGGSLPDATTAMTQTAPVTTRGGVRGTTTAGGKGGLPPWLPYAAVFAVGVIALAIVFVSATSGSRGGGGSTAATTAPATTQSDEPAPATEEPTESDSEAMSPDEGSLYLGVYEGEVVVYQTGAADPVAGSGVSVSELMPEDAAAVGAGVPVSSFEEAWEIVGGYMAKAQKEVEQQQIDQAQYPPAFTEASASSELPGDQITAYYGAYNVLNSDFTLAWNENDSGHGIGEWVMVSASTPQRVYGVEIVNGFPKTEEIYYKNNRCKDITIELSDGTQIETTLDDAFGRYQSIDFGGPHAITSIRIIVDSIYEGSRWDDTAICIVQAY